MHITIAFVNKYLDSDMYKTDTVILLSLEKFNFVSHVTEVPNGM